MELNFGEITLDEAPDYLRHWEMCAQRTSDYCFPIIWGLGPDYGTRVAFDPSTDLYFLHQKKDWHADLAPVGNWMRDDWAAVLRDRYPREITFYLVPEVLADIWKAELEGHAEVEIKNERGTWEYLYDINKLATLAGNKLMKKRNRTNQFRKSYDYEYLPITEELLPEIMEFQVHWCHVNNCADMQGLYQEDHAILRILGSWGRIPNLCGGAIRIDGKIVAYTMGELARNMLVVHFEKADTDYGAAYQAINRDFCEHMAEEHPELEIVNREEDLNDAGLRAAKMSYMPLGFIKECQVKIRFH